MWMMQTKLKKKDLKNMRGKLNYSIIARNRTIIQQRTMKDETNKTDRHPPITNHKPWPFELVEVKVRFPRDPLRWLTEQKNPKYAKRTARYKEFRSKNTFKTVLLRTLKKSFFFSALHPGVSQFLTTFHYKSINDHPR